MGHQRRSFFQHFLKLLLRPIGFSAQYLLYLLYALYLKRSLNSIAVGPGINNSIIKHMAEMSSTLKKKKRICQLVFDEVSIMPHLYISSNLSSVQGLEDFGFCRTKNIADHALVFMLKCINSKQKQPVAYYYVKSGMKTYNLKNIIKEIIDTVHTKTSFPILCTICD